MGRFPLFTDENVLGAIVDALVARGWDVLRAVDVFAQGADDEVLFEHAARQERVMVTTDRDMLAIAERWLVESRRFRGLIRWEQELQKRMRVGHFLAAFERYEGEEDPFAYPVRHVGAGGVKSR